MPSIDATVRRKLVTSFYDDGENRGGEKYRICFNWVGYSFHTFGNPPETNYHYLMDRFTFV